MEIQDELKEVLNEQPIEQVEEVQEVIQEEVKEPVKSEEFRAGEKAMQEKMQEAVNKRIAKEVAKRKSFESDFALLKREIEELKKASEKPLVAPNISDYEDTNKYVQDTIEYHQKVKAKAESKPQIDERTQALVTKFQGQEVEYAKLNPGYYQKVESLRPFLTGNELLTKAIFKAGPDVAEYLADNLEIADDLTQMDALDLGQAIGSISSEIKRSKPLPKKAINIKPEPTADHRGNTSSGFRAGMTQKEFDKLMNSL